VRNQRQNGPQELHQLQPGGYGLDSDAHLHEQRTPWSACVVDREATMKACGVVVAISQGHSWVPTLTSGS